MSKTLLAVDDSATIRKALEFTFAGEGYRVLGAGSRNAALGLLAERPEVVVVDVSLGSDDAYELVREVRAQLPQATILMLGSRTTPYDAARGQAAGADEHADKPFETQVLIDKVRAAAEARTKGGAARAEERPSVAAAAASARSHTLMFGASPIAAPAPRPNPAAPPPVPARVAQTTPTPVPPAPAATPAPAAVAPVRPAGPPAPGAITPEPIAAVAVAALAPKLDGLGLSKEQADAVLALSKDVVERVVWEVVPQLAEVMIREEIARLTRD